ncbi:hypothetical protein RND81_13G139200 [Saponaria officinalis]|uniref:DUF7036 domain-containing protein n=1 Tax=Saponaria officinalis TaxID=3572 RepID=A0AAW1GXN1_SAPOF
MGKVEEDDEFSASSTAAAEALSRDEANRRREEEERGFFCNFWIKFSKFIKLKCILALLLGISVLISALFWLPPFSKLSDLGDKDLDPRFRGHAIVASFKLQKPLSFVNNNLPQLEADIYDELEAANVKVVILSLESSGVNSTDIVFGIDPLTKRSKIPLPDLSTIRSYFGYFFTKENEFLLTTSVFGEPSFFEVLKFPGGITIRPPQNVYPLQKVQISFNFTLNNSILQIQENFEALLQQLNSGLHLTRQENLYISLTNSRGSTVAPPATVQTSVVLTVGVPSVPRMKQLAKTIKDSPARNLGLNNTVFGKVKQVSLSSILPASGASSPTPAPAPSLVPHFHHHHNHHHHHHHHHHGHDTYYPPASAPSYPPSKTAPPPVKGSPAPTRSHHAIPPVPGKSYPSTTHAAPAPVESYHARPPGCRFKFKGKHSGKSPEHSRTPVATAPTVSSHHHHIAASPHRQAMPPTPVVHQISPSSPLPNVIYARARPPPSGSEMDPDPPDNAPSVAPLPSSADRLMGTHCILSVVLVVLLLRP